ncbi:hypothetical protein ZIOFF_031899 [Zingiber officinale]|uniref:Uncharacterized protein n=1 Tax=Zingiber officinale TaxID=94328 RepID=A0A8J5GM26_ZINOF|nr:hypothetical protein ZIOFF_031899 [Zingiber officinale]
MQSLVFNHSAVMNTAGGVLGMVCGMLLDTVRFIIRTSSKEVESSNSLPAEKKFPLACHALLKDFIANCSGLNPGYRPPCHLSLGMPPRRQGQKAQLLFGHHCQDVVRTPPTPAGTSDSIPKVLVRHSIEHFYSSPLGSTFLPGPSSTSTNGSDTGSHSSPMTNPTTRAGDEDRTCRLLEV